MNEDEKVAALEWALDETDPLIWHTPGAPEPATETGARALLDAVGLIRTPIEGECVYCGWPINANQEQHAEDCPALPWVRAAARAGL